MKNIFKTLLLGIFAGLSISLGGFIFLILKRNNLPILGGFLFSVGLLLVCIFKFNLFTGKIGYVFDKDKKYLLDLFIMYLGNLIGALIFGYILYFIDNIYLVDVVGKVAQNKLLSQTKSVSDLILSGILCGSLVYISVDFFKFKKAHFLIRCALLILCIGTFVISGFDHCIANMFYFAFSNTYYADLGISIISLLLVTLGNSIGAILLNSLKHVFIKLLKLKKEENYSN